MSVAELPKTKLKKYTFTIFSGSINPVPYKRTTQKQKFKDSEYQKYLSWKMKVIRAFVDKFKKLPKNVFSKDDKYYVNIIAYYKDKTHGDTDNIAKGINDAIFQKPLNDKYIAGSYDFFYDKNNPRVEVEILEVI